MLSFSEYVLFAQTGSGPGSWPPPPRAPLPPFPGITSSQPPAPEASCWASSAYLSATPANIPDQPDRRWHRGNFSGVRVPGLTEGGNDKDPSLMITWDLTRYSDDQMRLAVDYYVQVCGYTHVVLSRPQTLNQGKGLADLIRVAAYCKSCGLFVIVVAVSDGDDFSVAIPWLDLLEASGVLDIVCFAWQADKWYQPEDIVQGILDTAAWAHPLDLLTTIHWGGGYPGWAESCACWNDETEATWGIHNRFTFQAVLFQYLDGHYGQCNTEAPVDQVQSWLLKALIAMPQPMFLVCAEDDAQAEYDEPHQRLERYGDEKGRLAVAADPGGRISYLNGARNVDGAVL